MDRIEVIENVELRKVWKTEPLFSEWLASDGLNRLGGTLGLSLSDAATEVSVGRYYADVVCNDVTDRARPVKVVIENQYDASDHEHLGRC